MSAISDAYIEEGEHRTIILLGAQEVQSVGKKMLDWGTCPREAGPPGPRLSSPGERERNAVMANRVGGQYVAVLFGLQLLLTHNPFNKVRGIFF